MKPPRYLLREFIVKKTLDLIPRGRFLEVGYGSGDMLVTLSKLGFSGDGVEISSEAKEHTKKLLQSQKITRVNLLDSLPIENSDYDVVVFFEVIGYWKNPKQQMEQLRSLIKPGGRILFSFTNIRNAGIAESVTGEMRCFSPSEVKELLQQSGFALEVCHNYGFPLTNMMKPLLNWYHSLKSKKEPTAEVGAAVKKSGLKRTSVFLRTLFFMVEKFVLPPFYYLQLLFRSTELGTGFVVVARKNS